MKTKSKILKKPRDLSSVIDITKEFSDEEKAYIQGIVIGMSTIKKRKSKPAKTKKTR